MKGSPQLRRNLTEARLRTDELFALVRPDCLFERPVPERHRLNFYIGHVEAFDRNMICDHSLEMEPFNGEFDKLFAFGIDPDSSALPEDEPGDWPGLDETYDYCRQARETVDRVLDRVPEEVACVCIEHRLMHAETLCYLLHNLASERLCPQPLQTKAQRPANSVPEARRWIQIPAGDAWLGRAHDTGFGWDNEFGELRVAVGAFRVTKYKVTNGEYLKYVEEGASPPHYWKSDRRGWLLRTMFGEIPLPLDWPVYVTHEQAREFAAYAGASLPGEAEWDRAAYGSTSGHRCQYPWGDEAPGPRHGNFDFGSWDPCPVGSTPAGDSQYGVSQAMGNGWEWTSDPLRPFPGFKEYAFYPAYSSDFFDDEHYVLKGGSQRTALPLLRRTFRNWFREGYPYVYSTFRLVER